MKATFVFITALSMLVALAHAADNTALRDFDGQTQTIDAYAGNGKWLVVMIWAHDCGICNQEVEAYAQLHEAHSDSDATVLGISLDGAAKKAEAQAFVERHDLPFPNLIGEPAQVMLAYMTLTQEQFRGTPSLLLYAPDGALKAAQAGAVPTASIEAYIARNDNAGEPDG